MTTNFGPRRVLISKHSPSKLRGKAEVPLMTLLDTQPSSFFTLTDSVPFDENEFFGDGSTSPKEIHEKFVNLDTSSFREE